VSRVGIGETEGAAALLTNEPHFASNVEVAILDPLCDPDWDRLVLSHPDCGFFHSAAWAKVLARTYRHKPLYLSFFQQGRPAALVPMMEVRSPFTGRRGVCLPFSDFCEPLIFDEGVAQKVLDKIEGLARERTWRRFEIRGGRGILPAASAARQFYGHRLALSESGEELLARFASPVRRAIRKAQKSGLAVQVATTREAIVEFYRLHVRTRRRHGIPPQPFSFFRNIYREAIEKGQGFVVLVGSGTKSLAAAVFLQFGRTGLYKFGASDESYQEFRGNNLVMWEAIRFLIRRGCQVLHFGRTAIENEGLRRFKMGWGTEEELIEYFEFDVEAETWKNAGCDGSGFYNKIFRRLPLVLNRFAGSVLYPHLD
jgi:CelD/BcsL family acetyltransferase involved in cellulose biosynthesis